MSYRSFLIATVAATAVSGMLHADPLQPIQAQKVDLGTLAGVAYYTVEPDGLRLVVTLLAGERDASVRFVATLAPGQAVRLSVAGNPGEPANEVQFVRHGEQLSVSGGAAGLQHEARGD